MKGMLKPVLSNRLCAVAAMVSRGNRVCDLGCDHGYVSIYLVQMGVSPYVIAMDVGQGPLAAARENIAFYGLEAYIETRLSNGLAKIQTGEAETLICAGMGGGLIKKILTEQEKKAEGFRELILQPQSGIVELRQFLRLRGYRTAEENMILEDGKYYPMMRVVHESEPPFEPVSEVRESKRLRLEDKYGPALLRDGNPVLITFLEKEKRTLNGILEHLKRAEAGRGMAKREEVLASLRDVEAALTRMGGSV